MGESSSWASERHSSRNDFIYPRGCEGVRQQYDATTGVSRNFFDDEFEVGRILIYLFPQDSDALRCSCSLCEPYKKMSIWSAFGSEKKDHAIDRRGNLL